MMQEDYFMENAEKMMFNQENYMISFRRNVETYAKENNLTLRKVSEMSNIPYATLNSFFYGKNMDCKLSTAVKLARALDVTLDELVGAGTLTKMEQRDLKMLRILPRRTKYLIHWLIEYHGHMMMHQDQREKRISVLIPKIHNGTEMLFSYHYKLMDVSKCSDEIKAKAYIGLKLVSENYMPKYAPGDILLIANNHIEADNMDYVIIYYGRIYLTKRIKKDANKFCFVIEDGGFQVDEDEIDGILGYIIGIVY